MTLQPHRIFAAISLSLSAALIPVTPALGETPATTPGHATKIVVPYAPGGPLDTTARILAQAAESDLGAIIIENKPGAGGNIGMAQVAKAHPDGKTLGIAAVATMAINPALYANIPFDAGKDFAGITLVARVPNVLVMNAETAAEMKIATVADLIAYGRANPGKLNYGSGGNGSAGHLAGELFKHLAQVQAEHVPYNGASPAQTALLAKEVHFNFDNLAAAAANIKAGKLVALAVTSAQPSAALPQTPTLQATLPGFEIDTWWGLVTPAGVNAAKVTQLNAAFTKALQTASVENQFANLMATPSPTAPDAFDAFMQAERNKYAPLVKQSGAKAD